MILVTGSNGFVGNALIKHLAYTCSASVVGAFRHEGFPYLQGIQSVTVGDISPTTDWSIPLRETNAVVHCAARVHTMNDKSTNPMSEFRRVNVDGTINLARQAAAAGVKRFVYLSSIKVNGEFTQTGQRFTADDFPAPQDSYGISKYEAEQLLLQMACKTGMEVVIIRPPLVYGYGAKANFRSMMRWIARGVPLPLAAITNNRRSLVALDNLVDLIVTCLNHPAAVNQIFLVSDGEDLSTADLIKRISASLGRSARLFYVPPMLLRLAGNLIRKPDIYQRLCGSLQLDIAKTQQQLQWKPPISVDEGLRRATNGYHK